MNQKSKLKKDLILEVARLQKRVKELETAESERMNRASDPNWRDMVERSPDHILALAPDLTILYLNHPSPGLTRVDLIGKKITQFLEKKYQREVENILLSVLKTEQPAVYETDYQVPGPAGQVRYYETHAIPRKVDANVVGLVLSSRDITQRKMIEKELREQGELIQSVFESAPVGIGLVIDRIILQANDYLCDMTGYTEDELINQSARIFYPTQEDYDFVGREKYGQIDKVGTGHVETRFIKKDGEIIDVLLSSTPIDPADLSRGVTFSALDISERSRVREELKEAANQWQKTFDAVPDAISLLDAELRIIRTNLAMEEMYPEHRGRLIGKKCYQIVCGTDQPDEFCPVIRVVDSLEREIKTMAVGDRTLEITVDPILNETDTLSGVVHSVRDITERVQAEKALLESESRYSRLTENARDMIYRMSLPDGRYEYVSQASVALFGYTPEEFYDSPRLIEKVIHPDWQNYFAEEWEKLINGNMPPFYEYQIIHKSGSLKWMNQRNVLISDSRGTPIAIEGIITDFTERIQTEQALKTASFIINSSPTVAFSWKNEPGWPVAFVTENVDQLLGYSARELLDGTIIYRDLIHPDDIARVFEEVESGEKNLAENSFSHSPYRIITKQGDVKWINDVTSLNRDKEGNVLSFEGIVSDITRETLINEDLRLRTQELNSLLKTSQALNATLEMPAVLQTITDSAANLLGIDTAAVYLLRGEELYLGATSPPFGPEIPDSFRLALLSDHPHIKTTVSSRQPVILDDTETADLSGAERTISDTRGLKSIVYLPIMVGELVLGTLIIGTTEAPRHFTDADLGLSLTLTNQVALSLQNSILHEESMNYSRKLEQQVEERKLAEHEKDRLMLQLQESNERLKTLSRDLIKTQEAERKRISQELHDELGQSLTAISLDLGIIARNLPPETIPDIRKRLFEAKKNADALDHVIGELALDLRPSLLDDLGLIPTLNWYADRYSQRAEIKVEFILRGQERRLAAEIETAIYRIVQEAFTNVVKHANASHIMLLVHYRPDGVIVTVNDNGRGFEMEGLQISQTTPRGLGLIGMVDRTNLVGGHFSIHSRPGEGTKIEIDIPD